MISLLKSVYHRITHRLESSARSPHWPDVEKGFLRENWWCRGCGGTSTLQVHHKQPFHLFPMRELDPKNLITLCMAAGKECHFHKGHLDNWKLYNEAVAEDCVMSPPKEKPI